MLNNTFDTKRFKGKNTPQIHFSVNFYWHRLSAYGSEQIITCQMALSNFIQTLRQRETAGSSVGLTTPSLVTIVLLAWDQLNEELL